MQGSIEEKSLPITFNTRKNVPHVLFKIFWHGTHQTIAYDVG